MRNLKFNQLLLLSNSEKSGNLFQFQRNLNLITAKDNNVGKSTLVKLLFWTIGCEPSFDTKWKNLDCKAIVKFEIDSQEYHVMRYKDLITLKIVKTNTKTSYIKITGDYAKKIAELLDFKVLLANRAEELETPPPAYYFLPFYIDQKRSWTKAWDNFEKLEQYSDWKSTLIKYHVGLLTPAHFDFEKEKYEQKGIQRIITKDIEKIDIALNIVDSYIPKVSESITTNVDKFFTMSEEIKKDLSELANNQEQILNELSENESEKAYLEHQKNISEKIIQELDSDYKFTIENVQEEEVECPLCGTVHENSIINRASILTDKQQAENQLQEINQSIDKLQLKIEKLTVRLNSVKNKIGELNSKYTIEDDNNISIGFNDIIESIAGKSIQEKVTLTKKNKLDEESNLEKQIKAIQKDQKDLQIKETIENIIATFNATFTKYAKVLGAEDINLSEIKSPLDYNKVVKEGGAAENSRAILAYYSTIYSLVETYGNEVKCAFIIDTPNQHEQSFTNYDKIIQLIMNNFPKDSQIILCAMENTQLSAFEKVANNIILDNKKLLDKLKYDEVKKEFDTMET